MMFCFAVPKFKGQGHESRSLPRRSKAIGIMSLPFQLFWRLLIASKGKLAFLISTSKPYQQRANSTRTPSFPPPRFEKEQPGFLLKGGPYLLYWEFLIPSHGAHCPPIHLLCSLNQTRQYRCFLSIYFFSSKSEAVMALP